MESVDELIELAAMLLEGQGDGDAAERFLDGVSRLCDERRPGLDRRTAGLLKQAGEPASGGLGHSGQGRCRGRRASLDGRGAGSPSDLRPRRPCSASSPTGRSAWRSVRHVVIRAGFSPSRRTRAAGSTRPCSPSGSVESDGSGNRPEPVDRLQAAVRAQPPAAVAFTRTVREHKQGWRQSPRSSSLRPEVPGTWLGALGLAVAALGTNSSGYWRQRTPWAGFDALGVKWSLTVLPE